MMVRNDRITAIDRMIAGRNLIRISDKTIVDNGQIMVKVRIIAGNGRITAPVMTIAVRGRMIADSAKTITLGMTTIVDRTIITIAIPGTTDGVVMMGTLAGMGTTGIRGMAGGVAMTRNGRPKPRPKKCRNLTCLNCR
jgi:hypothetical protein